MSRICVSSVSSVSSMSGICAKGLCALSPREAEPAAPQPVLGVRRQLPCLELQWPEKGVSPQAKSDVPRGTPSLARSRGPDIISLQQWFVIIPMWPPIFRSSAKRAAVGAHSRAAEPTAVALAAALAATATTATPSIAAAAALNVASCSALRHRGNEWPFRQFGRGNECPFRQFGPFRQYGR